MADDGSRIKRASFRAHHRGTKEMDIILGRFADAELAKLNEADLAAFETLLTMPDQPMQSWINGDAPPPEIADIVAHIRGFHGLRR